MRSLVARYSGERIHSWSRLKKTTLDKTFCFSDLGPGTKQRCHSTSSARRKCGNWTTASQLEMKHDMFSNLGNRSTSVISLTSSWMPVCSVERCCEGNVAPNHILSFNSFQTIALKWSSVSQSGLQIISNWIIFTSMVFVWQQDSQRHEGLICKSSYLRSDLFPHIMFSCTVGNINRNWCWFIHFLEWLLSVFANELQTKTKTS